MNIGVFTGIIDCHCDSELVVGIWRDGNTWYSGSGCAICHSAVFSECAVDIVFVFFVGDNPVNWNLSFRDMSGGREPITRRFKIVCVSTLSSG